MIVDVVVVVVVADVAYFACVWIYGGMVAEYVRTMVAAIGRAAGSAIIRGVVCVCVCLYMRAYIEYAVALRGGGRCAIPYRSMFKHRKTVAKHVAGTYINTTQPNTHTHNAFDGVLRFILRLQARACVCVHARTFFYTTQRAHVQLHQQSVVTLHADDNDNGDGNDRAERPAFVM